MISTKSNVKKTNPNKPNSLKIFPENPPKSALYRLKAADKTKAKIFGECKKIIAKLFDTDIIVSRIRKVKVCEYRSGMEICQ